jgi:flagellar export protein FliJ
MAFVFTLRALLRVREIHEAAELQQLQMLAAQTNAVRAEIEAFDAATAELRRNMCLESAAGLTGAELHFQLHAEFARDRRRKQLAIKLQELEKSFAAQQIRFLDARQQREVLSTLRDQQLAAFELEESRRAQQRLDELFLMRRIPARQNPESI